MQAGDRIPGHCSQRNRNLCSHKPCTRVFTAPLFVTETGVSPDVLQWVELTLNGRSELLVQTARMKSPENWAGGQKPMPKLLYCVILPRAHFWNYKNLERENSLMAVRDKVGESGGGYERGGRVYKKEQAGSSGWWEATPWLSVSSETFQAFELQKMWGSEYGARSEHRQAGHVRGDSKRQHLSGGAKPGTLPSVSWTFISIWWFLKKLYTELGRDKLEIWDQWI